MPVYEYECTSCQRRFEELSRTLAGPDVLPCPHCGNGEAPRVLSVFAARADQRSMPADNPGCGRCGDPFGPCGMDG